MHTAGKRPSPATPWACISASRLPPCPSTHTPVSQATLMSVYAAQLWLDLQHNATSITLPTVASRAPNTASLHILTLTLQPFDGTVGDGPLP